MMDPAKGDVFPEIASSFNASFERLRLPFQIKALDNFQGQQRDQARASAVVAASAGETVREQGIRALPRAPETRQAVEATLVEDDLRDAQLVRSEAITAEQAAKSRVKRRQDAEVTFVQATGDTLNTPDAVAAYRTQMLKDFSDGKTKLDAGGVARAEAYLEQRERQLRVRGVQDRAVVTGIFDKIVGQYADNIPTSPEEAAAARQKALAIPGGEALVADFDKRLLIASVVRSRRPDELDAMADEITAGAQKAGRGLSTEEGARIQELREMSSKKRSALNADPLAYARRSLKIETPPLVLPEKDAGAAVAAQIGPRTAAAKAAAAGQGTPVRYLTNDDRLALKAVADAGGSRMVEVARGIVEGAGQDAPAILREIGGDMPEMAVAGQLLAAGVPSAARTATDIATGLSLNHVAGAQGARAVPNLPKNAPALKRGEFGAAYLNSGAYQEQITAAAKAIYQARAAGKNIDGESTEGRLLYQQSLHEAAGRSTVDGQDYGGVTKYNPGGGIMGHPSQPVLVPPNVKADSFRSVIRAIRTDEIQALPGGAGVTASEVHYAVPVRVKGGYAFALGDAKDDTTRYVSDGKQRLVIDVEGMESVLRGRVPDAYLGGKK